MSQKFDAIYDKPWKQINDCLMSLKAFLWAEVKAVYTHLSTAVAWREKICKHFVFNKYFSLVLGVLKSKKS